MVLTTYRHDNRPARVSRNDDAPFDASEVTLVQTWPRVVAIRGAGSVLDALRVDDRRTPGIERVEAFETADAMHERQLAFERELHAQGWLSPHGWNV
jgi:hypothetical protein